MSGALRILAADAEQVAESHARAALGRWLDAIQTRTESEFLPWVTGYWTQQWLAMKLVWYQAGETVDDRAGVARLVDDLYDGYRDRVLLPVSREIDPLQVMDEASGRYVAVLALGLQELRGRHGLTRRQLGDWLGEVPAIAVPPGASLRDLVEAQDVTQLAAYRALTAPIRRVAANTGLPGCHTALRSVAQHTAERLSVTLAVRGGAAAASALGGIPGILLGLGISAWDAAGYEQERPMLEAALRADLDVALRGVLANLLSDRTRGVLAPTAHVAAQLESALPAPSAPATDEPDPVDTLF